MHNQVLQQNPCEVDFQPPSSAEVQAELEVGDWDDWCVPKLETIPSSKIGFGHDSKPEVIGSGFEQILHPFPSLFVVLSLPVPHIVRHCLQNNCCHKRIITLRPLENRGQW